MHFQLPVYHSIKWIRQRLFKRWPIQSTGWITVQWIAQFALSTHPLDRVTHVFEKLGPEHCQNDVWIHKFNLHVNVPEQLQWLYKHFCNVAHLFPIKWSLNVVIVLVILDNSALFQSYHLLQEEELLKKILYHSSCKYLDCIFYI